VIEQVPGPPYAGLIDQFTPEPAGRGSLSVTLLAVPVPGTLLLATEIVKPIGLPAFTVVASAVFVMLRLGDAVVIGKATTTSLNCWVFPPMSWAVVMSNTNWQKIGGEVGTPLMFIGVVQLVP
jgi:hypothetical protein